MRLPGWGRLQAEPARIKYVWVEPVRAGYFVKPGACVSEAWTLGVCVGGCYSAGWIPGAPSEHTVHKRQSVTLKSEHSRHPLKLIYPSQCLTSYEILKQKT